MTVVRDQLFLRNLPVRAFDFRAQGFSPPLARQRSSCPPPSPNLVRTHPIVNYQALRDSAPCLSRAATFPKATKLELGRGAPLKTPSSANHTAAASQPTGRITKAASWLHLSRVSPALHPPERPSHTHTPKRGFGGREHGWYTVRILGRLDTSRVFNETPMDRMYHGFQQARHVDYLSSYFQFYDLTDYHASQSAPPASFWESWGDGLVRRVSSSQCPPTVQPQPRPPLPLFSSSDGFWLPSLVTNSIQSSTHLALRSL